MIQFEVEDFDGTILGSTNTYEEAELLFLEYHKFFDREPIELIINKIEIELVCLDSYYEGLLTSESWKNGRLQAKICRGLGFVNRTFQKAILEELIANSFKIHKDVIFR